MEPDAEIMFTAGSQVACTTVFEERIQGEVLAFDYGRRVLVLKSAATNGKSTESDIHLLNMDFVGDVSIIKEVKAEEKPDLPVLNISKLDKRKKAANEERDRISKAFESGLSGDGVRLFLVLSKTLSSTKLQGKNIIVNGDVCISPPYAADCCQSKNKDALDYVKKHVERFHRENRAPSPKSTQSQSPQPQTNNNTSVQQPATTSNGSR